MMQGTFSKKTTSVNIGNGLFLLLLIVKRYSSSGKFSNDYNSCTNCVLLTCKGLRRRHEGSPTMAHRDNTTPETWHTKETDRGGGGGRW